MKRLDLLRHAEASWNYRGVGDIDRPLNQQGEREAEKMGKRLSEYGLLPDLIITSPAKRARQTTNIVAAAIGYQRSAILKKEMLYGANLGEMSAFIEQLADSLDHVMITGHNPTWTELANLLTGETIFNMPTCGLATIELNIPTWKELHETSGKLLSFDHP